MKYMASFESLETILPELQNIMAEYIFPKNCFISPLFMFRLCLRSCNSNYRKKFLVLIKTEIVNKMINFTHRKLDKGVLSLLFRVDHGIFQGIEHIDLSGAEFPSNLLLMLPITLKAIRFQNLKFLRVREIQYISHLVNLTSLDLEDCRIDDGSFLQALAELPPARNLSNLRLTCDPISGAGTLDLVRIEDFSKLTCLDLTYDHIGDDDVLLLARSPHMANLTNLNLSSNLLGDASMIEIARSPYLGNLTILILNHNRRISDEGVKALSRSSTLSRLTKLELGLNQFSADGLISILQSEYLTNLTALDLPHTELGDGDIVVLKRQLQRVFTSSVTSFNLSCVRTSFTILLMLLESSLMMNLSTLDLRCGEVTYVEALVRSSHVRNIKTLNLSGCKVTDESLKSLVQSSNFMKLTSLDLSCNYIRDDGVWTLTHSRYLRNLAHLDLNCNAIRNSGARILAESDLLGRLKYLNLSYNEIETEGIEAVRRSKCIHRYSNLELEFEPGNESDFESTSDG